MNFLQTGRISLASVALNIMTCLEWGVALKMFCTSPRMSAHPPLGQVELLTSWSSFSSPGRCELQWRLKCSGARREQAGAHELHTCAGCVKLCRAVGGETCLTCPAPCRTHQSRRSGWSPV